MGIHKLLILVLKIVIMYHEKKSAPFTLHGKVVKSTPPFHNVKDLQQYITIYSIDEQRERTLTLFGENVIKFQEIPEGTVIVFTVKKRDVYNDDKIQKWINVIDLEVYE